MGNDFATFPTSPYGKTGWPWTEGSDLLPDRMPDGSDWPKISIVTPSFNQAQYLEETIRSVLMQGYPNLEYMIIDGGSTDGSIEIIKKYEPWLAYWVSEPDCGQSHAINKGWKRSGGDLLAWLNSDDFLARNALETVAIQYSACEKGKVGFIHGKAIVIDEEGQPLFERGGEFDLIEVLRSSWQPVAQSSAFFSSIAVREVGYLNEDLHMSMDYDLYVRIARHYKTMFIPEALSYFRLTQTSKTSINYAIFGPDHVKSLDLFYQTRDLPKKFLDIKREAYANAFMRSFQGWMRQKQPSLARRAYMKALLSQPLTCLRRTKGYYLRYLLTRT